MIRFSYPGEKDTNKSETMGSSPDSATIEAHPSGVNNVYLHREYQEMGQEIPQDSA